MTHDSNIEIIEGLRAKSEATFELVYRIYFKDVYRFVKHYVMSNSDSDDIVQDTFYKLWDHSAQIPTTVDIKAYLFAIAKNLCLNNLRHKKIVDNSNLKLIESIIYSQSESNDSYDILFQKLTNCINQLPENQKKVINLKFIGYDYELISQILNIPKGSVHTNIKRAYKYIRKNVLTFFG